MERAPREPRQRQGQAASLSPQKSRVHRRSAARDPIAPRWRLRTLRRRRTPRRLVGLERRQARRRMVLFAGPGHHGDAARHLRAGLRPRRAHAAGPYCRRCQRHRPKKHRPTVAPVSRGLGVATEFDLRDYFRLGVAVTRRESPSWSSRRSAFGHGRRLEQARLSRPIRAPAAQGRRAGLAAPFDPLIWERDRTHRIFDFFYRIEIYTPVANASTVTTCCLSCWATGWWRGSISRPIAQTPSCSFTPLISSRITRRKRSPYRCARSCG